MHKFHVSLRVKELPRSIDFYTALFGVPPDKQTETFARFQLLDPPLVLSLQTGKIGRGPHPVQHFGLRLDSAGAYEAARSRLVAAGIVRKEQAQTSCCHAVQDKVWARDPDGCDWELYRLLKDLPVESGR